MNTTIQIYNDIVTKVRFFFKQLHLKLHKSTGRPLTISPEHVVALALFKQSQGIKTKKAIWRIFDLHSSCKTLAVNMNRFALHALLILNTILKWNRQHAHIVKHTDSTDVPVCLPENAKNHRAMRGLAEWGYSAKGRFYGLKMVITADLKRNLLAVRFASGNANEREVFKRLNRNLMGIFVADAGFVSKNPEQDFFIENKRIPFAEPRANMKRIAAWWQNALYNTGMIIELNFRNLKMFYNLETSLPRSLDGYFGNCVFSLSVYVLRRQVDLKKKQYF